MVALALLRHHGDETSSPAGENDPRQGSAKLVLHRDRDFLKDDAVEFVNAKYLLRLA